MASRSGSRNATPAVASGFRSRRVTPAATLGPRSRKGVAVGSALPACMSDSESDELAGPEKGIPAPSHASAPVSAPALAPAPTEIQTPMYTEADLLRILKIFSETKGQTQSEAPHERSLKAKAPDVYYGKSHMDCYHFCQQCEDHFETAGATGSNCTPFAASFLCGKINFRWHQHQKQLGDVPVPWEDFKAFLRKSLGDSRAFVDTIWSNIKRDSQYQLEEVQDWASHLEHLQSILVEFDEDGALVEASLIQFFREDLKPSIKAQMDPRSQEYDSWDELVEKTVAAEAKASLQPSYYSRNMDNRCPKSNRPSHTILSKPQPGREPREESSERALTPQAQKNSTQPPSNSSRPDNGETSEKKSRREKKKQRRREQACKDSTPDTESSTQATGGNTTASSRGKARKDLSHITCFNCDKKGYYANKCPEPRKESDSADD